MIWDDPTTLVTVFRKSKLDLSSEQQKRSQASLERKIHLKK